MLLHNTLTRREEEFAPARDGTVRMYACGLTVYARGHIGNFRTFVALDVLRRTLRHVAGFDVQQVINFTDVDDKTIKASRSASAPESDNHNGNYLVAVWIVATPVHSQWPFARRTDAVLPLCHWSRSISWTVAEEAAPG